MEKRPPSFLGHNVIVTTGFMSAFVFFPQPFLFVSRVSLLSVFRCPSLAFFSLLFFQCCLCCGSLSLSCCWYVCSDAHFIFLLLTSCCPSLRRAFPSLFLTMARHVRRPPQTNAEMCRLYRRKCAMATGPEADARRNRTRELNRERQIRFRDRQSANLASGVPHREIGSEDDMLRVRERDAHRDVQRRFCGRVRDLSETDARRTRERNGNRERQREFRERLTVPLDAHSTDDFLMGLDSDGPDDGNQPSPPYLPLHQKQAVHDFLDRLLVVGDDLHECAICLEKYHGMSLRGSLCTRCHSEVTFSHVNIVAFSAVLMMCFSRATFIVSMRQKMPIPEMFRMSCATCYKTLLRWRKCCAVSHRPASSCG